MHPCIKTHRRLRAACKNRRHARAHVDLCVKAQIHIYVRRAHNSNIDTRARESVCGVYVMADTIVRNNSRLGFERLAVMVKPVNGKNFMNDKWQ